MEYQEYLHILGANIKRIRLNLDMTQEELSEAIGITSQFLSYIESGSRGTSLEVVAKLAKQLNVHMSDLFVDLTKSNNKGNKETLKNISIILKSLSKEDQNRIVKIVALSSKINIS